MESDRTIAASHPPPAPPGPSNSLNGASNAFSRVRPMHGRTSGPTRRSTRGQWTPDEDEILCKAVQRFKGKNWKKIAECFKDRTDVQCLHRWQKVLNPELIKGPWSKEEDEIIVQLVNKYGPKKWSTIAQHLPGRIGKQCRERWHNHLNPAINKEAWTQEEELVLIRAHQMHGNRWAELTKYLPGRTDNAIKNHWNSSVKKKLDSYIASGLLAQFQNLPVISHQSQSMPAASMVVQQNSGDGSAYNDGVEVEQNSESSQIDCSQSASDMSNTAYRTTEDFLFEESDRRTLQSSSPTASCSEQYYTSVEDITFTIPNIPYEFNCSSGYLEDNYSRESGDCAAGNSRFGVITLPNVSSVELGNDSSNLPGNYYLVDPRNDVVPEPSHQSYEYEAPGSINNVAVNADAPGQRQNSSEDCSELILQQEGGDGCPVNITNCSDIMDIDRFRDYISFQSIYQLSETSENVALQPNDVLDTLVEASDREHLSSVPSEFSIENGLVTGAKERSQINDSLAVTEAHDIADVGEGLAPAYINTGSPCQDPVAVGLTEQKEMEEPSRLVPVNSFGSQSSDKQQSHSNVVERPPNVTCGQEAGTLCYQPPRFPSLDIPFFSCDLAHSCNDPQQDFSPLGIRQLMMSSMNSLTPFKLWDSPPSDDSPKAVLKSAAKSFACTPSILKKRHRDLLSPLSPFSERRLDKRTGSNVKQGILSTSRLTSEFSRLDVMFDEADDCKESTPQSIDQNNNALIEDKENVCPERQREEAKQNLAESGDRTSEENNKDLKDFEKEDNLGQNTENPAGEDCASETPKGVLVERYLSDIQFSSPDGTRHKAGSAIDAGASEARSLKNFSEQAATSESMSSKAKLIVSPSLLSQKKQNNDPLFSGQSISAATSVMVDSLLNEVGAENLNIFGGTPFRRSIESPSAWKSPWYFSSLVNCPRFDSDLMVEDYGFFMSPGERSVDAIGLMKQINEQGADAFADARAVLGSETPESILRQRCSKIRNLEGESSQLDSHIQLASDVLTERRVLDFSECETPAKSSDKGKGISAASLSSPSTCLLKSYR